MAVAIRRQRPAAEQGDVASSLNNLALVLRDLKRLAEAETLLREALAISRQLRGDNHPDTSQIRRALNGVLEGQGKPTEDP